MFDYGLHVIEDPSEVTMMMSLIIENHLYRSTACETNDGMDHSYTRASKRSSRILAKKLGTSVARESPPLPKKLPKLQVVLNRKEIQDDWFKITGHKYTGKPKKSGLSQWVCFSFFLQYYNETWHV